MTEKFELYKCNVCGNLVEVRLSGVGVLVCCGEPMELVRAKNTHDDEGLSEKHSPVIGFGSDSNREIRVIKHPMINEHYIMFVECISQDKNEAKIKYFYPEQEVIMRTDITDENLSARSYCNIHGLYNDNEKEE
ncbi:MAG: desulfoferrodoxin FeS4 iron-binding domain-containing protein [Candidatus Gastranaerophilales bacterium]|nr:desulfoferrodoxin FeS4 iron-binding domain-containing protein [Candidatus Gastranaerophilales bacterium]